MISTLPSGDRALDAGRPLVGRDPAACGRAVGDIDVAVAAEQAGIRRAAGMGVLAKAKSRVPGDDLALIGVGEDHAPVRQDAGALRLSDALCQDSDGLAHGFRSDLLHAVGLVQRQDGDDQHAGDDVAQAGIDLKHIQHREQQE
jgi:hypothetical protein